MHGDIRSINAWARDYKRQTLARATNGLPPLEPPPSAANVGTAEKLGKNKKRKTRKSTRRYRSSLP